MKKAIKLYSIVETDAGTSEVVCYDLSCSIEKTVNNKVVSSIQNALDELGYIDVTDIAKAILELSKANESQEK